MGIHVLAAVGLVLFPVPGPTVLLTAFILAFLGGLGTTVGYHRSLAHLSVRLRRPPETLLTFFAMFNGSGAPQSWAANHRMHHANADKEKDISSPRLGGFWWSHLRWLWQAEPAPVTRWAPDLDTPYYRFWTRWQWAILLLSLTCGAVLGWAGFFWIGAIRLVFSLHGQCFVNSIAHMREDAAPGEDSSQNIAWLGFVHYFQGENWHGNHHAKPWSARIGWTWWQLDLGWTCIRALEMTGLATKVNRPR
jgi:stearoyl-CoA desaturase (delta-9 desaturase)